MNLKKLLTDILIEWAHISGLEFTLLTAAGESYIATGSHKLPSSRQIQSFISEEAFDRSLSNTHYYKIIYQNELVYLLIVWGRDKQCHTIGELAVCQISSVLNSSSNRLDKNSFIQNLLMGNYNSAHIQNHAKKLRITHNISRVVFLIDTSTDNCQDILSVLKQIYPLRGGDFITTLEGQRIVLVKEVTDTSQHKLEQISSTLVTMINTEAMVSAWVGYSRSVEDLNSLPIAYREALTSLEVGKIFTPSKYTFSYQSLGLGHLIYQLPIDICEMFIQEVLHGESLEDLDEETLNTIRIFFNNNLNLSETSRQLYLHRNTLVYRFEKLQKKYGLDIRTFEDAMTFNIAMMVVNYIKHKK